MSSSIVLRSAAELHAALQSALETLDALASNSGEARDRDDANECEECTRVHSSLYQIVVYKCESCGEAELRTSQGAKALSRAALEAMKCGGNHPDNLITLCSACHRQEHRAFDSRCHERPQSRSKT